MKQVGNVYLFGYNELEEYKPHWFEQIPNFEEKSCIRIGISPNPEKIWPGDQEMLGYINRKHGILIECGILSEEALADAEKWNVAHVEIAAEFENLESAEKAFNMAKEQSVVDIYLYAGGILYDKFD